jgi:Raf kinase inhibitor-like YbhB/YbcL family protein
MTERPHPEHSGEAITILKIDPILDTGIVLTSTAQEPGGKLADRNSAYFDNLSPPLRWTNVPDVKAWAIIVEDPDAPQRQPFVHWMIWNILGEINSLPEGLPTSDFLATPQGGIQGRNGMHGYGWFGPRPPEGHGVHRYYFQIFALDDFIEMGPETPLQELVNALKGNTIAKGEMMATYEAPAVQPSRDTPHMKTDGGGGGKGAASHGDERVAGDARLLGEKASPGDRKRGETSPHADRR